MHEKILVIECVCVRACVRMGIGEGGFPCDLDHGKNMPIQNTYLHELQEEKHVYYLNV